MHSFDDPERPFKCLLFQRLAFRLNAGDIVAEIFNSTSNGPAGMALEHGIEAALDGCRPSESRQHTGECVQYFNLRSSHRAARINGSRH